jgi:hypothetical protein
MAAAAPAHGPPDAHMQPAREDILREAQEKARVVRLSHFYHISNSDLLQVFNAASSGAAYTQDPTYKKTKTRIIRDLNANIQIAKLYAKQFKSIMKSAKRSAVLATLEQKRDNTNDMSKVKRMWLFIQNKTTRTYLEYRKEQRPDAVSDTVMHDVIVKQSQVDTAALHAAQETIHQDTLTDAAETDQTEHLSGAPASGFGTGQYPQPVRYPHDARPPAHTRSRRHMVF